MNRKLLAAAVAGALVPMAAQAVDVSVSGHVNRMIRYADDGHDSDIQHLDNGASGSRWRLVASGDLDNGLSAGATLEQAFVSSSSGGTALESAGSDSNSMRHSYIWLSGAFGKLTLGHTGPAGNSAMWESHNGAWMAAEYSSVEEASAIQVRTSGGAEAGSLWSAFGSVSIGRDDVLRYDTPAIGPATLGVSINDDDNWGVVGKISTEMGGTSFIGGAFVAEVKGTDETMFGMSGGVAFANGTSVNAAYGSNDAFSKDHDDFYVALAHSWGNSNVVIDYRNVDGRNADFDDAQSIGIGFQQSLGSGVDVYAGFHNFNVDSADDSVELDDVNVFHIGSRVRFN